MSENPESQLATNNSNEIQTQLKGVITKFLHPRNFGFIKSSNGEKTGQGKEIFFHKTGISNSKFNPKIKEGDKCLFDISKGDKGIIAKNIVIYYRPIPKIKHKQINLVQDEKNLKMALFTNTMLGLFNESTRFEKN